MPKVRRKACRHCLFSKNYLGRTDSISQDRGNAIAGGMFHCHEHSEKVVCAGFFARCPNDIEKPIVKIQENGDLKHKFSHLKREEMSRFLVRL